MWATAKQTSCLGVILCRWALPEGWCGSEGLSRCTLPGDPSKPGVLEPPSAPLLSRCISMPVDISGTDLSLHLCSCREASGAVVTIGPHYWVSFPCRDPEGPSI